MAPWWLLALAGLLASAALGQESQREDLLYLADRPISIIRIEGLDRVSG